MSLNSIYLDIFMVTKINKLKQTIPLGMFCVTLLASNLIPLKGGIFCSLKGFVTSRVGGWATGWRCPNLQQIE